MRESNQSSKQESGTRTAAVIPQDVIEKAIRSRIAEELKQLERNGPEMTDERIEQIAQEVADEMAERYLERLPESERKKWTQRLKEFGTQVLIGCVSSGIWMALVYAFKVIFTAPIQLTDEQRRRQRRLDSIRKRLAGDLSGEKEWELDQLTEALSAAFEERLKENLATSDTVRELVAVAREKGGHLSDPEDLGQLFALHLKNSLIMGCIEVTQDLVVPSEGA